MPHVADGILHAYLDGALDALGSAGELPDGMSAADVRAHLELCADCRARLEEERAVRERAGMVLSAAAPAAELRPFSEIAGQQRGRRRSWLPMAWAASVLLAVGAGWWGSEVWRMDANRTATLAAPEAQLDRDDNVAESARAAEPAAVDQAASEMGGAGAPAFQDMRRAADGAGASAPSERAPVPTVSAERLEAPSSVQRQSAARADAPARGAIGEPAVSDAVQFRARDEGRGEVLKSQVVVPAAPAPPPAAAPEAGVAGNVAEEDVTMFTSTLKRALAPRTTWDRLSEEERASARLAVVTVQGAGRPDVAVRAADRLVRVRQRLDGGHTAEILTWTMHTVALQDIVVTGAAQKPAESRAVTPPPAREEALAAAAGSAAPLTATIVSVRETGDGQRELIARVSLPNVLVAIRTSAPEHILHELARQLVLQP